MVKNKYIIKIMKVLIFLLKNKCKIFNILRLYIDKTVIASKTQGEMS